MEQPRLLPDDSGLRAVGKMSETVIYRDMPPGSGGPDVEAMAYFPYRPALYDEFLSRFHEIARRICAASNPLLAIEQVVPEEYRWASAEMQVNPRQRRIYRAALLLLRDLLRVRWTIRWRDERLEIAPPLAHPIARKPDELHAIKETIRSVMAEARRDKLAEAREFIARMEAPSPGARARVPITALIADGEALAAELRDIATLPDREQQLAALRDTIRPYLQLVVENETCPHTGHRLSDIWRYFRLTWATPAENTPGRTMLYLIRDAARPFHPVIGIASLENTPLRITARDSELGWTLDAFRREVLGPPGGPAPGEVTVRAAFGRLLEQIATALGDLRLDDLCTPEECERPTEELVLRLARIAADSDSARHRALRAWWAREGVEADDADEMAQRSELGNISRATEEALYRRKRAEQTSRLLNARRRLTELLEAPEFAQRWRDFLGSEQGQSAVWTALVAMKNRHIGTSLLELNVCGAIAPYNALLGGKLIALLMLSPQVVADYRARYGTRSSDIASRLKGTPVVRPAELVYLGTSSLYRIGSSQYNRLKLPAGLLREGAGEVRWRQIGETVGYGTLHISRLTLQCLEEAADPDGRPSVNHVFGEGASPKLRIIRSAFTTVFDTGQRPATTAISRHAMGRLVYGAWLAENGPEYLRGETDHPSYFFDDTLPHEEATERIAEFWRERWLLMRLRHGAALDSVAASDPAAMRVSADLRETESLRFTPIRMPAMGLVPDDDTERRRDFVRRLYRGSSAYADRIDTARLAAIHVATALDVAVRDALSTGRSVVLTGNPGDGKTHLLRMLEGELAALPSHPVIVLDASEVADTELHNRWAAAIAVGQPFCVAINEAVLYNLAKRFPTFAPLQEAQRQVERAVLYGAEQEETAAGEIVAFDLSHRDVLSSDIVAAALDALTDDHTTPRCAACPSEGCDFVRHRDLLRLPLVRERLQSLLDRVSRRGHHATMRDLQAFVSYLLFAGRDCDELVSGSRDPQHALPQLPFVGVGPLFEALLSTFDPASVAHPIWDERLVHHGEEGTAREDWPAEWPDETGALDPTNEERFISRKRAFYLFHRHGDQLLAMARDDETAFARLLALSDDDLRRRLLNLLSRFFGDTGEGDGLPVWQGHRYDQSPRRVLYAAHTWREDEFEVARPRLRPSMAGAFSLARDHVLLRLHSMPRARLRVDFALYQVLAQIERGVPALTLDPDVTRRIWTFMEQLTITNEIGTEARVTILDPISGHRMVVSVDTHDGMGRYLAIALQGDADADRHD